jgi:hypothetical protein
MLFDEQCQMMENAEPGCFYDIHNLRLKRSSTKNGVLGCLGGSERLIKKLKSRTPNEELGALLLWVVTSISGSLCVTFNDLLQAQETMATGNNGGLEES